MADTAEAYGVILEFDSTEFLLMEQAVASGVNLEYDGTFTIFSAADMYNATLEYDGTFTIFSAADMYNATLEYDGTFTIFSVADMYNATLELEEVSRIPYQPALISDIDGTQSIALPTGSTVVTLQWNVPSISEYHPGEYLGKITDTTSQFEFWTKHRNPVDTTADPTLLYEAYHDSTAYKITTTSDATAGSMRLSVDDSTTIPLYSWIKVVRGDGYPAEFNRVVADETSVIKLQYPVTQDLPSGLAVAKVWVNELVETVDYTISSLGYIETVAGQLTQDACAFIRYKHTPGDLDHFEIWTLEGQYPEEYGAVYSDVTDNTSAVLVDGTIGTGVSSYDIGFDATQSGSEYTVYLYAVDIDGNTSLAQRAFVETLPSIPINTSGGYDDLTKDVTLNFSDRIGLLPNGVNVFRCDGSWDASNAIKVNVTPITGTEYIDGTANTTNRVSELVLAYPSQGNRYLWQAERADSVTDWPIGTQNAIGANPQVDSADKDPEAAPEVIPPGWTDIPPA